jgi:hypothetical protein
MGIGKDIFFGLHIFMNSIYLWRHYPINSHVENSKEVFVTFQAASRNGLVLLVVKREVKPGVIMRLVLISNWLGIDWITELH